MMKSWVINNEALVVVMESKRVSWKIFMSQSQQDLGITWM